MRTLPTLAAAAWLLAAPCHLTAQDRSFLGPRDGRDLPPMDTARVGVGDVAPDFTLESRDGAFVTLSGFRSEKDVVLVFYRGHW